MSRKNEFDPKMKIEVYNDGELISMTTAGQFLEDNQFDEDVSNMLADVSKNGESRAMYFSGEWFIKKVEEK